jgi:hypothetical protein
MLGRKLMVLMVALSLSVSAFADDLEGPESFSFILGPSPSSSPDGRFRGIYG